MGANDNTCTEAEALDWQACFGGGDDDFDLYDEDVRAEERLTAMRAIRFDLLAAKRRADEAPAGAIIACAQCGQAITKKTYHMAFCSNAKTHGTRNCKDRWHNRVRGLTAGINEGA